MIGININCKDYNFIADILCGAKTIETRDSRSLDPYIGKRVGLIQTGRGKAFLIGYATITARYKYETAEQFDDDYYRHRCIQGGKYHFNQSKTGVKYGYLLEDVEMGGYRYIDSKGIVARQI